MIYDAHTIPLVDPMMVRKFTPSAEGPTTDGKPHMRPFGGLVLMNRYEIEEVGIAEARLPFPRDEDVVDCSHRIFSLTTCMMMDEEPLLCFTAFNARRFRNHRDDSDYVYYSVPTREEPLLYIGNPIRVIKDLSGITVHRLPEFLIKSGAELGL